MFGGLLASEELLAAVKPRNGSSLPSNVGNDSLWMRGSGGLGRSQVLLMDAGFAVVVVAWP